MWHDRDVADPSDDQATRADRGATAPATRSAQYLPAPLPPAHVVEPEQPSRIRRPNDGFRLIGWTLLTGLLLVVGDVALGTTAGLEEDLAGAITTLPDLILRVLAFASSLLLLILPPLILADLALRRRWRTMWVAVAAGVAGWLISYAFSILGPEFLSPLSSTPSPPEAPADHGPRSPFPCSLRWWRWHRSTGYVAALVCRSRCGVR